MFSFRLEQKSRAFNMLFRPKIRRRRNLLLVEAYVSVASVVAKSRRSADLESMSGGGCIMIVVVYRCYICLFEEQESKLQHWADGTSTSETA